MSNRPTFFGVDRYITESRLEELKEQLEKGEWLSIGVSCLGHGHNNAVQEDIKRMLEECYGDRLITQYEAGGYSYSYNYKLK